MYMMLLPVECKAKSFIMRLYFSVLVGHHKMGASQPLTISALRINSVEGQKTQFC